MRIQHNITAMNAYRNFSVNNSALSKNLEKLSAGYKINRAGDDAAGLAISEKMRAQITGLDTAQKNAKDGISLVQTAEGALTEVHDMLNRMVELTGQSANGTYANELDREQLQKEIDQLRTEIDRIADSANFNGINLLDGSMQTKSTAMEEITVASPISGTAPSSHEEQAAIFSVDLSQFGAHGANPSAADAVDVLVGGQTVAQFKVKASNNSLSGIELSKITGLDSTGISIGGVTYTVKIDGTKLTLTSKAGLTQELSDVTIPVTLSFGSGVSQWTANQGNPQALVQEQIGYPDSSNSKLYSQANFALKDDEIVDGFQLKLGDETYTFAVGSDSKFTRAKNVIDLTDQKVGVTGIASYASKRLTQVAKNNDTFMVNTDANGASIYLTEKKDGIDYSVYDLSQDTEAKLQDVYKQLVQKGVADPNSGGLTLQIGDTSTYYDQLNVSIQDMHAASLGLGDVDITTQAGATAALDKIKAAINTVSDVRGTLGATQNRLDHTINNLSVMVENITDAESTIRDTDMASEMMAYTKNSILVQAAQAMLAQANQLPQGVLQLLQ